MALQHAAGFARRHGHELVALHVIDPTADETISPKHGRLRVAQKAAALELQLLPALKKHGARLTTILTERDESIADGLRRGAAEEGAALLALGSRGAGNLQRRVLGGVATDLLGSASLPMLLTGSSAAAPAKKDGPMLWLSDDAVGGAALARGLHAVLSGSASKVVVLHLQSVEHPAPLVALRFEARIEAIRRLLPADCEVAGRFEQVDSQEAILPRMLDVAKALHAESFALATSSHRLGHRLWGASTTLRLLEKSPIPLIVVARR